MATYTFGTLVDPAHYVETPDLANPGQVKRPDAGVVLQVKNAATLADLPTIVTLTYGYWSYSTVEVPAILVSGDGGTTWVGPLIAIEAQLAAGTQSANISALTTRVTALEALPSATEAVQAHEEAVDPHPQYARFVGASVGARFWGGNTFPTAAQGAADGDYLFYEG